MLLVPGILYTSKYHLNVPVSLLYKYYFCVRCMCGTWYYFDTSTLGSSCIARHLCVRFHEPHPGTLHESDNMPAVRNERACAAVQYTAASCRSTGLICMNISTAAYEYPCDPDEADVTRRCYTKYKVQGI